MALSFIKQGANPETVRAVISEFIAAGCVDPDVAFLAKTIVLNNPDKDPIRAVYDFVKANVRYVPDPKDMELFIAPWRMAELVAGGVAFGDCDDSAIFTASLLRALGYRSKVVLLALRGEDYDHATAMVFLESAGVWVMVDTTNLSNPMGWSIQYLKIFDIV